MIFNRLFLLCFLFLGCAHSQKEQQVVKKDKISFYEMEGKKFLGIFKCVTLQEAEIEVFKAIFDNCNNYGLKAIVDQNSIDVIKCDENTLSLYISYECRR